MTPQPAPRVFISYSHDTVEHQERVLSLADRLRADGIDAEIDQYNAAPPEGWPLWCERQIAAADIVLMVCTETYHRRVSGNEESGKGLGDVWEAPIIRQLLYDAGAVSDKFVPVLFSDASPEQIPTPIRAGNRYVVDTEHGYKDLLWRLTGQPRLLRPVRALSPRHRQWPEARVEAATAPAPSSASRSSKGRGTITAGGDLGGDHSVTEVPYRKVTLPSADRIDIRSELAALKELLVGLNTGNRTKIANALAEAADEAAKPQPDKNEIGGALERALGYAGKATDFGDKAGKIATHVQNAVAWLGDHWRKLLPLVGNRRSGGDKITNDLALASMSIDRELTDKKKELELVRINSQIEDEKVEALLRREQLVAYQIRKGSLLLKVIRFLTPFSLGGEQIPSWYRRDDEKTTIALLVIKSFFYFVFLTFLFVAVGFFMVIFGINISWIDGANLLVEIIKIAMLPIVMLVLGFYFGKS